jgi:hypothetical protein
MTLTLVGARRRIVLRARKGRVLEGLAPQVLRVRARRTQCTRRTQSTQSTDSPSYFPAFLPW